MPTSGTRSVAPLHARGQLLVAAAVQRAAAARGKFGPHPSAEFACCRLAEEVGKLTQAATAMSKARPAHRRERMWDEAVDVLAMLLRLLDEFPAGREEGTPR